MAKIVDTARDLADASSLARRLAITASDFPRDVVYVKLPDGSIVHGFDVEEETLTDGSKAMNVVLKAS